MSDTSRIDKSNPDSFEFDPDEYEERRLIEYLQSQKSIIEKKKKRGTRKKKVVEYESSDDEGGGRRKIVNNYYYSHPKPPERPETPAPVEQPKQVIYFA